MCVPKAMRRRSRFFRVCLPLSKGARSFVRRESPEVGRRKMDSIFSQHVMMSMASVNNMKSIAVLKET